MENNPNTPALQSSAPVAFNFFDPVQFETMQRVCKLFASSELVPDMYRAELKPIPVNPDQAKLVMAENKAAESKALANCMIAIEMAQRIGASPLMIMQNMVIIYGRPSWSSKFLVATVNTCGRFEPLKYRITNLGKVGKVPYTDYVWANGKKSAVTKEYDGTQIDNLQCIAYTCAKSSDEVLESAPIDIRLAIQEGWYTKTGSKWVTMTRQMLMYRAASFWTNAYAPELSMGMKTVEEVQDIIDIDYEDVSEKVTREKAGSANKQTIAIDDEKPEDKPKADENQPEATQQPAAEQKAQESSETKPQGQQPSGDQPGGQLFEGQTQGKTRQRKF